MDMFSKEDDHMKTRVSGWRSKGMKRCQSVSQSVNIGEFGWRGALVSKATYAIENFILQFNAACLFVRLLASSASLMLLPLDPLEVAVGFDGTTVFEGRGASAGEAMSAKALPIDTGEGTGAGAGAGITGVATATTAGVGGITAPGTDPGAGGTGGAFRRKPFSTAGRPPAGNASPLLLQTQKII